MVFERPLLLGLIPLALFLLWLAQRRSLVSLSRSRLRLLLGLRSLIVILLIVALAGPFIRQLHHEPAVVFLRDVSDSLDHAALESGQDYVTRSREGNAPRSASVVFAGEALVEAPFGGDPAEHPVAPVLTRTSLASALDFGAALLPADRPGRLVVLTDGQSNEGPDPETRIPDLKQRQIEVDVVPLRRKPAPDAAVVGIEALRSVQRDEVYDLEVRVNSVTAVPEATVRLFQNDLVLAEQTVPLGEGITEVVFPRLKAEGNAAAYEVQVVSPGDSVPQNDRAGITVAHEAPSRVLIVDREPVLSEPLAAAFRQGGLEVEIRPPSGLPTTLSGLQEFQLIALADAPAADFSSGDLESLATWVRDFGGGLLVLGGENSFGAGGYSSSPLARLLPVSMERTIRDESPVVALLVILDRSGSMSVPVEGRTKMSLANDGAALALGVLEGKDIFGVYAVDTRVQEAVPLGPISDVPGILRRIAGITPGGGGIYIYTSLAEALPQMRTVRARIKHIILFSDAADAEEKAAPGSGASALDLATALLANQITLSVVALGRDEDADTAFLRDLAFKGGGRFYLTSDATTLPRLFAQETLRATQSSLQEDPFLVQPVTASDATGGIRWEEAPPLLGQNLSQLKPGASQLLVSEKGQPVLAEWRVGSGRVAAFLSDARDRWASEWLAWEGYGKFWSQLARLVARPDRKADLAVDAVRERDGRLAVEVSAIGADGAFRNALPVTVTLAAEGDTRTEPARQTGPGRYETILDLPRADIAMLAVTDGSGSPLTASWTRRRNVEYLPAPDARPFLEKLAQATGGLVDPAPDQVFRPSPHARPLRVDLSGWFLLAAALLWVVDVWLRRRDWQAGSKFAAAGE